MKEDVLYFQISQLESSPSAQPCSSVGWEQNGYYEAQNFLRSWVPLKLISRLPCSVRFVFVSTFSLQRGKAFVVGITNLSKYAVCVKAKAPAGHMYQRTWDEFNSFERSPRKSTRRGSRELGIPQPTVWRVLRRRLLFKPHRLQLVQALWVHLFESPSNTDFVVRNVTGWQRLENRAMHNVDDLEPEFRDFKDGISYTQKKLTIRQFQFRPKRRQGSRIFTANRQSKYRVFQVFRPIYLLNIWRTACCRRFLGLRWMRWQGLMRRFHEEKLHTICIAHRTLVVGNIARMCIC